jgi:hypothetical protein
MYIYIYVCVCMCVCACVCVCVCVCVHLRTFNRCEGEVWSFVLCVQYESYSMRLAGVAPQRRQRCVCVCLCVCLCVRVCILDI